MPRRPRTHYVGAVYHVILRGNGGQPIFGSDQDRCRLALLLNEGVERFRHRILGFCFMPNHLHLVIQVDHIPLSRIMQNVTFRYTRWYHKQHGTSGHLFHARYKAVLIEGNQFIVELVRYVHANPVRSGLVTKPEEFSWSGHNSYLGKECLPWLDTEWVLSRFSISEEQARKKFRKFVTDGLKEGHRDEFHRGNESGKLVEEQTAVMDDLFAQIAVEPTKRKRVSMAKVIQEVCRVYGITEKQLIATGKYRQPSEARAAAAWVVRELPGMTLTQLGEQVGRDAVTLSNSINRIFNRANHDPSIRSRLESLAKTFNVPL